MISKTEEQIKQMCIDVDAIRDKCKNDLDDEYLSGVINALFWVLGHEHPLIDFADGKREE